MALERDNQHIIAAGWYGPMLVQDNKLTTGGAIDTRGMRGMSFVLNPVQKLNVADVIEISFEDSVDGINWKAVAAVKQLPSERQAAGNLVCNAVAPWLQVEGVVGNDRYLRMLMNGVNIVGMGDTIDILIIGHPENLAFRDWDPLAVSDGNP